MLELPSRQYLGCVRATACCACQGKVQQDWCTATQAVLVSAAATWLHQTAREPPRGVCATQVINHLRRKMSHTYVALSLLGICTLAGACAAHQCGPGLALA